MEDKSIGTVSLHDRAELVFTVSQWKGRQYASVRKFIDSPRYSGPTKAGLNMVSGVLIELVEILCQLQAEIPEMQEREIARIKKSARNQIVLQLKPPDDKQSMPVIDIREYMDTLTYSGPTKKGIRVPWDKLKEVIAIFQIQLKSLEEKDKTQLRLFPKARDKQEMEKDETQTSIFSSKYSLLLKLLPGGIKDFPKDFVDDQNLKGTELQLPEEKIEIVVQMGSVCLVKSDFGFCFNVRNQTEGNYIFYSWLRGYRKLLLPNEMIVIFRAVKGYENYLRDLQNKLLREYERKTGLRSVAEYQAHEDFESQGLPWIDKS